jgi:uncharacterized protein (TIGR03435 family)
VADLTILYLRGDPHASIPVVRCLILLFAATLAWPQTFEVASVKPSGPDNGNVLEGGPGKPDPGLFRYTGATLEDLIVTAYNVEYFQVSSKVPIDRDRFDVLAKVPPGTTREQLRTMLQNLLAERFRLKLHRESREFSGYALVVAKSGHKLDAPPKPVDGFPDLPPDRPGIIEHHTPRNGHFLVRVRGQQKTTADIASSLHVPGNAPVVDRTGLNGKYDFTLEYSYLGRASDQPPEAPPAPAIFTALQQQLGLQLVSRRLPFDAIVVDSFDRVPSQN